MTARTYEVTSMEVLPKINAHENMFRKYHDCDIISMLVKAVQELKADLDLIKKINYKYY